MNIELRWLVTEAPAGYYPPPPVLQYRERESSIVGMDPFGHTLKQGPWSDWHDVPVEAE